MRERLRPGIPRPIRFLRKLAPPTPLRQPEGWSGHDALWQRVEGLAAQLGYAGF